GPVDRQGTEGPAEHEQLGSAVGAVLVGGGEQLGAHRVAHDLGPGQVGVGERGGVAGGEAGEQAVGGTGHRVLLVHDDRDPPEHGGDAGGDAGVAADGDDGGGPVAADE